MTNRVIMNRETPSLRPEARIGEALDSLYRHRSYSLPVVDEEGRYLGMYGVRQILARLLPKAVIIEDGLDELGYVTDTLEQLRERLHSFRGERIGDALDHEAPAAGGDAPLLETLLHLYHGATDIPIVDPGDGALQGAVTPWEILAALTERTAPE